MRCQVPGRIHTKSKIGNLELTDAENTQLATDLKPGSAVWAAARGASRVIAAAQTIRTLLNP